MTGTSWLGPAARARCSSWTASTPSRAPSCWASWCRFVALVGLIPMSTTGRSVTNGVPPRPSMGARVALVRTAASWSPAPSLGWTTVGLHASSQLPEGRTKAAVVA